MTRRVSWGPGNNLAVPPRECHYHSENQAFFHHKKPASNLKTTTAATSLATGGVGWGGGYVLDSAYLHTGTSKSAESGLRTWTGGLGTITCEGR
jgi:hypothetical protein